MKPQVTIELPPHLHDYLYHEFGTPRSEEAIKEHPVTLVLPVQEWNHFIFQENFIYIPEWKQRMLREYIEASYRIRIREYFIAGYEKGYKQDRIIRAFLYAYNIKNNAINYDAVKKYDYRNRQRMVKEVDRDIQLSLFP